MRDRGKSMLPDVREMYIYAVGLWTTKAKYEVLFLMFAFCLTVAMWKAEDSV